MSIFSKQQPAQEVRAVTVNGKSEFHLILEDIDLAQRSFESAAHRLSQLMMKIEKGVKFAERLRTDLTQALEDHGGVPAIVDANIEAQIAEYAPKRREDLVP